MKQIHHGMFPARFETGVLLIILSLSFLLPSNQLHAVQDDVQVIEIRLGDYRFTPGEIQLVAGQPAVLRLINTDSIIPHNFTLIAAGNTVDIDADVLGGESIEITLKALPAGRYTFYCANKLPFMKSHRDKGMTGILLVSPD